MQALTNSNDPFEDPNFNIIAYLNEKFPDEESLASMDTFIAKIDSEISSTQETIETLLCEKAHNAAKVKDYLSTLDTDVSEILELIESIKKNSDSNEATVKSICNDIKSLDNARGNITNTISMLTKLVMLINGIENLETTVKNKDYSECAHSVDAANEILELFKDYSEVKQIKELMTRKTNQCKALSAKVIQEFKNTYQNLPDNENRLHDAAKALNSLGSYDVDVLRKWFAETKLRDYLKLMHNKRVQSRKEQRTFR